MWAGGGCGTGEQRGECPRILCLPDMLKIRRGACPNGVSSEYLEGGLKGDKPREPSGEGRRRELLASGVGQSFRSNIRTESPV